MLMLLKDAGFYRTVSTYFHLLLQESVFVTETENINMIDLYIEKQKRNVSMKVCVKDKQKYCGEFY